jgi:hypothetical protein
MGWAGISMVRVRPGETPEQAVAATIAEWIEVTEEGLVTVSNPGVAATVPSDETDTWMDRVVESLEAGNPKLRMTEEKLVDGAAHHRRWIVLDDDAGPVYFVVYPGEVMVKPGRGYQDPEGQDGSGFAVMWGACQLLARQADCVAYAPDEDEMVDLSLDVATARERYFWM